MRSFEGVEWSWPSREQLARRAARPDQAGEACGATATTSGAALAEPQTRWIVDRSAAATLGSTGASPAERSDGAAQASGAGWVDARAASGVRLWEAGEISARPALEPQRRRQFLSRSGGSRRSSNALVRVRVSIVPQAGAVRERESRRTRSVGIRESESVARAPE